MRISHNIDIGSLGDVDLTMSKVLFISTNTILFRFELLSAHIFLSEEDMKVE